VDRQPPKVRVVCYGHLTLPDLVVDVASMVSVVMPAHRRRGRAGDWRVC